MERDFSILLIEDDPIECGELAHVVENTQGVILTGITNNIIKGIEYVKDSLPDAIILDLELHKGYGNGLEFLKMLQNDKPQMPIYILVTTNNISYITHESARQMGADFIMVKSQEDYCAQNVIDFLMSIKNIIRNNKKITKEKISKEDSLVMTNRMTKRIIAELDNIGIASNAIGRKYIIDSILLIVGGETEKLYRIISEKYGKTESSIERAMQNAIQNAWKTTHIGDLELYYTARIRSSKGVPTIMEFLYYYAEKIKSEYL